MAGIPPNSLRQDELPEYTYKAPFGGIQSEVSLDQIGRTAFSEVQNLIFRKSQARLVPAFVPLASPSGEIVIGIADFFNKNGVRSFIIWTPTSMWIFGAGGWTQITGALTGSVAEFMGWDVVGYKIYFSQQKDKVQVWDGITGGFADAAAGAVPGKYLCELNFHLLVANTIEGGIVAPNRIHWTGAGDGTDWTSFNSGQTDLFNGLGPINGMARIYQAGFAFQQWGITQIIPTGIGTAPFQFVPLGSRAKGSILPYGVASFGEVISAYVGKNDIYAFDGTQSEGIGSRPIDGNRRLGARGRIFADLFSSNLQNVSGFIASSMNGNDYESYWLFIPSLNKAWIYHFDEGTWTQEFFGVSQLVGPVGVFSRSGIPRIEDLIGTILQQSWSPASLVNISPLDTMAISDGPAQSVSLMDFGTPSVSPTSGSINPADGWYIKSGQLNFDDPRHLHSLKRIRLSLIDYANVTIHLRVSNEYNEFDEQDINYGSGTGQTVVVVVPFELGAGKLITWELSGPQGINWGMSEISIVYDTSGEVRAGGA